MPVDTKHPEYEKASEKMWPTMRDVIAGEDAVKDRTITYLPYPAGAEVKNDTTRYKAYILRANFVTYTSRTTSGLNGAIFRKDPTVELPSTLDYMKEDADGSGQDLNQVAKELTQEILDEGRAGLMLDRPESIDGATLEDDINNKLRANLSIYKTESIINWKTVTQGGATILTMVVLMEVKKEAVDEFEYTTEKQYRVLALDESGYYFQQLYNEELEMVDEPIYPQTNKGQSWERIPFIFVGSKDNTPSVDEPPFYGMAKVNLAHYRNSADYEEGVHMFGQPTPWVDVGNSSQSQWNEANKNGITVGSRNGITVGQGGSFNLAYMEANSAAKEAMDQKEDQMISIGAKIVQSAGKNQTAEEARINASAEHSVLNTIVGNANDAIETLLKAATEFEGGNPDEVQFSLNDEFFPMQLTAQQITAVIMLADRADIAQSDVRELLRKTELLDASRSNEDIDNEIEESGGGLNAT